MKKQLKYILYGFKKHGLVQDVINNIIKKYLFYLLFPNFRRNSLELLTDKKICMREIKDNKYIIYKSATFDGKNWLPLNFKLEKKTVKIELCNQYEFYKKITHISEIPKNIELSYRTTQHTILYYFDVYRKYNIEYDTYFYILERKKSHTQHIYNHREIKFLSVWYMRETNITYTNILDNIKFNTVIEGINYSI